MAKQAGRDPASLPIKIFRVPDVLGQLKFCRDIGVDRGQPVEPVAAQPR